MEEIRSNVAIKNMQMKFIIATLLLISSISLASTSACYVKNCYTCITNYPNVCIQCNAGYVLTNGECTIYDRVCNN